MPSRGDHKGRPYKNGHVGDSLGKGRMRLGATTRVARTKMGKGNLEGFVKGYIDGEVIGIPADILAGLERSVWSVVAGIGIGCVH